MRIRIQREEDSKPGEVKTDFEEDSEGESNDEEESKPGDVKPDVKEDEDRCTVVGVKSNVKGNFISISYF